MIEEAAAKEREKKREEEREREKAADHYVDLFVLRNHSVNTTTEESMSGLPSRQ